MYSILYLDKRFLVCVPSESFMCKRVKRLHLRFRCEDAAKFTARLESARRSRDAAMFKLEAGCRLRKYCHEFGISMPLQAKKRLGDICIRSLKKLVRKQEDKSVLQSLCEEMLNQLFEEVETDYKMTLTKHSMGVRAPKILPSLACTHPSVSVSSQCKKMSRRSRFSMEFLDTVVLCRGKFEEVAGLKILDTDWGRSRPEEDPKPFLFSGRSRLGAASKGWDDRLANEKLLRRRSGHAVPLLPLTLPEFAARSKVHAEEVTVIVQRHWRECAVRVIVDKLAGGLNFLRDDTASHLKSPQHRICAVIDNIIGDVVSQWMEKCVTAWVELIENPSSFPLIKIELDLSETGQVVLSPSVEEIQEVFEEVLENVYFAATELPTLEPELFTHCQIPSKPLGTVDSELITILKARLRSALLNDLRPALKLLADYQPFETIREVAAELSNSQDDLSAALRAVEWSGETKDAINRVCPGGVQSTLFIVDTGNLTEKLISIVEQTKQGVLIDLKNDAETKARGIEYAFGSLREKLNSTPSEEEVEGALTMVETIEEQSLAPLDQQVKDLLEVLEFLEGSEFILPMELLRASYDIRNAPVQARNNLKSFSKRLQSQNRRRLRRLNDDE
ncbi:hypothetical protein FOL47_011332 [Perkinsus chesapeaki]|uniref:Uncharacterized protein n=1 Tax=Perkinsus chesapeaki TaxID=330153 RepID=A0A7J6MPE4_PERCH|nr:hypothetical protein FOL47_011332 [Perkinsus chesapeaki]